MGTSVPTPPETDFYRAFSGRVRETLTETTPAPEAPTVPATFQAAPDAPCELHAWCVETGAHIDHFGRRVSLPSSDRGTVLEAHFYTDEPSGLPVIDYDRGIDDWREFTSGDELRAEVAKVRAHLVRLEVLADEYDAVREAAGQQPAPATGRQWTLRTEAGATVNGYLPPWAEDDPSEDGVPDDMLAISLTDLQHTKVFGGQSVTIDTAGFIVEEGRYVGPGTILSGSISCRPFSDDELDRQPLVHVELFEGSDDYLVFLDPAGVTDLAAKLRAQADILDQAARDLAAARADWDANGGAR